MYKQIKLIMKWNHRNEEIIYFKNPRIVNNRSEMKKLFNLITDLNYIYMNTIYDIKIIFEDNKAIGLTIVYL